MCRAALPLRACGMTAKQPVEPGNVIGGGWGGGDKRLYFVTEGVVCKFLSINNDTK